MGEYIGIKVLEWNGLLVLALRTAEEGTGTGSASWEPWFLGDWIHCFTLVYNTPSYVPPTLQRNLKKRKKKKTKKSINSNKI